MDAQLEPGSSNPLKILCLDGGGVRGLSSLLILEDLMESLQHDLCRSEPPRPCEIFDIICGTSTGGLIALMLGRLRMSVKDAINSYCKFSEVVFGSTAGYPIRLLKCFQGKAMYDASKLERCIKDVCREHGGGEDALLRDPRNENQKFCRVFVVAVTRVNADGVPRLFRSYATRSKNADRCTIWEAARATTAATLFFDPMEVGSPPETLIDGGFSGANNPSKVAVHEARTMFPRRPVGFFLSVGTGVGKVVSVSAGFAGIAMACAKLITDCEVTGDDVSRVFYEESRKSGQANPYFRFSVSRGLAKIRLDEWRERETLVGVTRGYLRSGDPKSSMEHCVNVLSNMTEKMAEEDVDDTEQSLQ